VLTEFKTTLCATPVGATPGRLSDVTFTTVIADKLFQTAHTADIVGIRIPQCRILQQTTAELIGADFTFEFFIGTFLSSRGIVLDGSSSEHHVFVRVHWLTPMRCT
jgi:hypothetical protein